jgi:hypothetical protein
LVVIGGERGEGEEMSGDGDGGWRGVGLDGEEEEIIEIEAGENGRGEGLAEGGEAGDDGGDVLGGVADGAEGIGAEVWVIEVNGEIFEHELEGSGGIFEIVDEESGDGLEGVEFVGIEELLGELEIEEEGSEVVRDGGEEAEFVWGEGELVETIGEDDGTEAILGGEDGDAEARGGGGGVEGGEVRGPRGGDFVEEKRVGTFLEFGDGDGVRGGRGRGGGEVEELGGGIEEPEMDGAREERLGDEGGGERGEIVGGFDVGEILGEERPDVEGIE